MMTMPTPKPEYKPLPYAELDALRKNDYDAYRLHSNRRSQFQAWEAHDLACRVERLRAGLNIAFKMLRKQGFIARQNYLCCGGCAGAQIAIDAFKMHQKGKKIAGSVTYNRQSTEDIERAGEVLLAYGQIEHSGYADGKPVDFNEQDSSKVVRTKMGKPTKTVGKTVVAVMQAVGLQVEWDGDPNQKIRVFATADAVIVEPGSKTPTTSVLALAT